MKTDTDTVTHIRSDGMDGETRAEIAAIREAINEVKRLINMLFDREETRISKMSEIERDFALHCQSCAGTQANRKAEFDALWTAIKDIRGGLAEKPKKSREILQFSIYILTALSGWVYMILKGAGILP